jgi:hypothetical protein
MFWLSATSRSMAAFTGALREARALFQGAGDCTTIEAGA